MDTEGTYDARGTRGATPLPRPAGPPVVPPAPTYAPATGPVLTEWLDAPRHHAGPGVWAYGHVERPPESAHVPGRTLVSGAVISLLACVLVWSLWRNGYIPYWRIPLELFTPGDWWSRQRMGEPAPEGAVRALEFYRFLIAGALLYGFGRLGNWRALFERTVDGRGPRVRAVAAAAVGFVVWMFVWAGTLPGLDLVFMLLPRPWLTGGGDPVAAAAVAYTVYALITLAIAWPFARLGRWGSLLRAARHPQDRPAPPHAATAHRAAPDAPATGPADWPELRAQGLVELADRLSDEVRSGRMNDVDYTRVRRAWRSVQADPSRLESFTDAVRRMGSAACVHPSGARDLPVRAARHDLFERQVRLGTVEPGERNPYARRGTGLALDPELLGTSLLAVGPPGTGKTRHLVRPVVESLALQALAGQAAVIVVAAAGTQLGPDDAYDVVVKFGDPASVYDFDLYGGTTDPDEAAAVLAEAFTGDLPEVDSRRASTALAQLLGPYRAAHGHFPSVPELRELLDGVPAALATLREALDAGGHFGLQRELDARARQSGAPGDPGPALADRVATLDRPAFAGFFDTDGRSRPFSLRSLEHPVRVRIDLPERGHAEASRVLARLVLAQFTASASVRADRSLFACLVLDDATRTVTADSVRSVQRLRSAHAGAVLTLRSLSDVPEELHTALLGAVGCRMAFSGVTTWEGRSFAEAWGTEWVETRDVTQRTVFADQPLTRAIHSFRKLVTGKAVTTDAVTVRKVERERWSASDLAHSVPASHAVLSLTTVRGEHAPPLLVDLRG
ncbi:ATP/GTP-binding protein [Streptomyces sp. NBC_01387]|uniref:ATP/GTP-binding protein n=1 Tax=unclassified Streptomyces TaxID=2593676 RepID=UPI00224C8492|nr:MULTISPECIES: ATP/GTP-binding protein [unclassified Streptomyces]MCX4547846.1 ATP/GTP-binding protein [Streptomyces sp. NBC_01500]